MDAQCLPRSLLALLAAVSSCLSVSAAPGGAEALIEAARRGELDALNQQLEQGVDVNSAGEDGWTALHAAAKHSRDKVLVRLIEAGANVNAEAHLDVTPLHWAASRGPLRAVRALVSAGAHVRAESLELETPLGAAAKAGRLDIAEHLLESGARVSRCGATTPPLVLASRHGHLPIVELLVENGAKVNDFYHPALHWARTPEMARLLLKLGADVDGMNLYRETALHLSTGRWAPNAATVEALLAAKAHVNETSRDRSTPLHAAIRRKELEIVKLLIAAGADVDSRDHRGNTPLSLAERSGAEFVKVLVAAGAEDRERTPLLLAVESGRLDRVRAAIREGQQIDQSGPLGISPLHAACELGHEKIVAELIGAGASIDQRNHLRRRPLHGASNAAVARLLLDAGASLATDGEKRFQTGEPVLYSAAMAGHADVVALLLERKAKFDPDLLPNPLVWAAFTGREEVVEVLIKSGMAIDPPENDVYEQTALCVVAGARLADMNSPRHVTPATMLRIARRLIGKGAKVNSIVDPPAVPYLFTTPLMEASRTGQYAMTKLLLQHGAKVNTAVSRGFYSGRTALHLAAKTGSENVVRLLLAHKADVNAVGGNYRKPAGTPLDFADDPEVRAVLKRHGGKSIRDLP